MYENILNKLNFLNNNKIIVYHHRITNIYKYKYLRLHLKIFSGELHTYMKAHLESSWSSQDYCKRNNN